MNQQTSQILGGATDEAAVRHLYQQLMDGWNKGSSDAFAAMFAEDCVLVAFDGTAFKSRQEIVSFHQPLFDTWLKGTRLMSSSFTSVLLWNFTDWLWKFLLHEHFS